MDTIQLLTIPPTTGQDTKAPSWTPLAFVEYLIRDLLATLTNRPSRSFSELRNDERLAALRM
jgi:hypothetical protein